MSVQAVLPAPVLPENAGAQAASPSGKASAGSPFGTVLAEMSSETPAPEAAQTAGQPYPKSETPGTAQPQLRTNSPASTTTTAPAAGTSFKAVLPGAAAPQFLATLLGRPVIPSNPGNTPASGNERAGDSKSTATGPQTRGVSATATAAEAASQAGLVPPPFTSTVPVPLPAAKSATSHQPNDSGDVTPEAPTANSLIANAANTSTSKATQANGAMRGAATSRALAAQRVTRTTADMQLAGGFDNDIASSDETEQTSEAIPASASPASGGANTVSTTAGTTNSASAVKAAPVEGQPMPGFVSRLSKDSAAPESLSRPSAINPEHAASAPGNRRPVPASEQSKSPSQSTPLMATPLPALPVLNPIGSAPSFREREAGRPHVASQNSPCVGKAGTTLPVPPAAVEVRIQMGGQQHGAAVDSSSPAPETDPAANSSATAARSGASAAQIDGSAGRENKSASHGAGDDNDSAKDDNAPDTRTASQNAPPNAGQYVSNTFTGTHGAMSSTVTATSSSSPSAPAPATLAAAAAASNPAQAPQNALPAKADAAPASASSHAQELADDGKTQQQPLRSISLEFTPDGAQDVRVRLQERGGDVHISLHSTDAALSGRLRDGVQDLAGALSNAGYNADAWASGGGRQQQQQRDAEQQRQPQRRNDQNAAGNDFSGMMQQTNQETL